MSATFMAGAYVRYWLKSKTAHGIHSPFVYDFYQNVWKAPQGEVDEAIERIRQRTRQDPQQILVTDLGAGSTHTPERLRSLAAITQYSAKSIFWVQFMTRLVQYYGFHQVLDLGTSIGLTTSYLARIAEVTTVEGCPTLAAIAQDHFEELNLTVAQHVGNLDEWLPEHLPNLPSLEVVILDANHQYEPTLQYVDLILENLPPYGCLLVDDIHWSKAMEKAWNKITQDERVSVSIDLFGMGILFVRPDQAKEHFILR